MNSDTTRAALWRAFRVVVVTALVQTFAMQVDWANPNQAFRTLVTSFISGVIIGGGKVIRDNYGSADGTGLVNKLPL